MTVIHYIGLDVHKKTISYCIKTAAGQIVQQGRLEASRSALRSWAEGPPAPWSQSFTAQSKTTSKPFRIIMVRSEWFSLPWVVPQAHGDTTKVVP